MIESGACLAAKLYGKIAVGVFNNLNIRLFRKYIGRPPLDAPFRQQGSCRKESEQPQVTEKLLTASMKLSRGMLVAEAIASSKAISAKRGWDGLLNFYYDWFDALSINTRVETWRRLCSGYCTYLSETSAL